MPCPLIYLLSLSLLAGAAALSIYTLDELDELGSGSGLRDFSEPTELNISTCPFTFYGQTYNTIFVSFTGGRFVMCFTGFYNPGLSDNCIIGAPYEEDMGEMEIGFDQGYDNLITAELPEITRPGECYVSLVIDDDVVYRLHSFGRQSALYFSGPVNDPSGSVDIRVLANGTTIQSKSSDSSGPITNIFDLSGCRHLGVVYAPGNMVSNPDACLLLICNETSQLQVTGCGPTERCLGNNMCVPYLTCTVAGPAVIDFSSELNSALDSCGYELVSLPSEPDFKVKANFRERRLEDVNFLDSVTVQLGPSTFFLGPYGTVELNDTTLTLSSSVQDFDGVKLSKDQSGVMATVMLSNYNTSVLFDGTTMLIGLEGPQEDIILMGLCSNSSYITESRISAGGCDTQNQNKYIAAQSEMVQHDDNPVSCKIATERCNLLRGGPFAACNYQIDPEPYINACKETLCRYPLVDGLTCQFLEAYATVCEIRTNTELSWRSTLSCLSPVAFCQGRVCTDNEFCSQTLAGEAGCFCRANFASSYRSSNTLGGETVCNQNTVSVTLVGCLLEEKGIDISKLHLNDQSCRGLLDKQTNMVTFSFGGSNTCGAVITTNNTHAIYKNTIKLQNMSSDVIIRKDQVYIDFACILDQSDTEKMSFRIKDSSVIEHITSGVWEYNLTMRAYSDASRTQVLLPTTEVQLDQRTWVELKTEGLDGSLVAMVTDSCWATNEPTAEASLRYDLINGGCANPDDHTVMVMDNGLGTSNYFSFNMFQFSGNDGDVYLHCKVKLCVKQNNTCTVSCNSGSRRRRSVSFEDDDEDLASISLTWFN
ncbi:uncharacterized protein ACBR49_001912 [Aulostomus maculatus]